MQKPFSILVAGTILLMAACSSTAIPFVHKIDIQQGNVITQDMVDRLEPGMDKSQVQFVLGTPPLIDVFHQQRWDYVYSMHPGGGERQQRHIALFFEGDKLTRIEGDVQPAAGTPDTEPAIQASAEPTASDVTP